MPHRIIAILFIGLCFFSGCFSRRRPVAPAPVLPQTAVKPQTGAILPVPAEPNRVSVPRPASAADMPLESVFEINGTFGSRVGMPYTITLLQKGTDIRCSANAFFDEFTDRPVDVDSFCRFWAVCEQADLESLRDAYGRSCGPADFTGNFTCRVRLPEKTIDRSTRLTYGTIDDPPFARLYDALMTVVGPRAHLPFYSLGTLDYSRLPRRAELCLEGKGSDPGLTCRVMIVAENGQTVCRTRIATENGSADHETAVSTEAFEQFWQTCAAVDLAKLNDCYGDMRYFGRFHWDLGIELQTEAGRFGRQIIFADRGITDPRFARFLDAFLALADHKLTIPLNHPQTAILND